MAGPLNKVIWMLVLLFVWWGTSLAALPETGGPAGTDHVPDELIVKYRSGTENRRDELHRRLGSRRLRKFQQHAMERVKIRPGTNLADAIREFGNDPDVEYAEPNYLVRAFVVPSDLSYFRLWGMEKINAPAAWNTNRGSSEVVVAVIDSGIDYNHPDLQGNLWTNAAELNGKSGVDDDGNGVVDDIHGYNAINGSGSPFDDDSHGTHVAGIIGAVGNNGVGVTGVSWNVRIMACKFIDESGSGTTADAIECLDYVTEMRLRGTNVIASNNSWGGTGNSRALRDSINNGRDILFITAAGNDGTDNDASPSYPANYELPNIISVAATTSGDALAGFSQFGRRTVHVGAPGSSIYSTYPGNAYTSLSGTSMATPHVTGLAALIKAARPNSDWREIRNLLLSGGSQLASLTGKTVTGKRIDAFNSLTCLDNRLFSALRVPAATQAGIPVTLSALSINCAAPLGPVTVTLSHGELYQLKDDGASPDQAAGDGIFAVSITPNRSNESFSFSSPAGSEQVGPAPLFTIHEVKTPTRLTSLVISGTLSAQAVPTVSVAPIAGVGPVTVAGNSWSCAISGLAVGDNIITIRIDGNDGTSKTETRLLKVILPDGLLNGTDTPSIADALRALRIAVGLAIPTPDELLHGDVAPLLNGVPNPDDKIDVADALLILRRVVHLVSF